MKRLYECRDRLQAQMLHDALASHHITTLIQGDYLQGGVGELSAQFPVLWVVEDGDYYLARQLIERYLPQPAEAQPGWRCGQCGEWVDAGFELCWNCSHPREPD